MQSLSLPGITPFSEATGNEHPRPQGEHMGQSNIARRHRQRPVWYTISDLAQEFDTTLRALRFYEAKGLLSPIRQGTSRIYSARDRIRLQLILTGKQLGFTLCEISSMISDNDELTEANLKISPDLVLRQIAFLEDQQKTTATALSELRRRYYLMTELDEPEEPCHDTATRI